MKRFFLLVLSLLSPFALPAADSKDTEDESAILAAESPEVELNPEKKLVGEWQGFIMIEDIPVQVAENRFRLLPSGTWEILDEAADAEPEPQGWYKISKDERKDLLLQPHAAAVANENAAIQAVLIDDTSFSIGNPLEDEFSLCFIKTDKLTLPTMKSLAGKWTIKQTNPESAETRTAPYSLILKEDGSYRVDQPGKDLPEEWAQGTYTVSGIKVQLKNKYTGSGFWKDTCFFLFGDTLRYNDSMYLVWGEKQPLTPPEPAVDPAPASKSADASSQTAPASKSADASSKTAPASKPEPASVSAKP